MKIVYTDLIIALHYSINKDVLLENYANELIKLKIHYNLIQKNHQGVKIALLVKKGKDAGLKAAKNIIFGTNIPNRKKRKWHHWVSLQRIRYRCHFYHLLKSREKQ